MNFYNNKIEECLKHTNSKATGLSSEEANKRLEQNGLNVLPSKKPPSKISRFFAQFKDIMIIILFIAAGISIVAAIVEGHYSEMIDGFIILAIVLINALLGFVQELKAEKEMKELLKLSSPEIKVMRDGEVIEIDVKSLVVGDVVVLEAGDIVPADLRLIDSASLKCDESSLTGESVAVEKSHLNILTKVVPLGDRSNMVFKGSIITSGRAMGLVAYTGANTELGKIAKMLSDTEKEITPLQKNIKTIGKIITFIVLGIASVMFAVELLIRPNPDIMQAFMTAVVVAVAAIPESLPAVITIIMSLGVARLSKQKAIIKRLHAVETLGSTQIICSDKTGTLTQNVMTVRNVFFNNELKEAQNFKDKEFAMLLKSMTLCNDSILSKGKFIGDPTETALTEYAKKCGVTKSSLEKLCARVNEIPFDSTRKLMTTLNKQEKSFVAYTKGAPDNLLKKCNKILLNGKVVDLSAAHKKEILNANKLLGDKALRVLGFAYKNYKTSTEKLTEKDMVFVGLVGMIDPPRPQVFDAVSMCKQAHMKTIMITGDHKDTAFAIAKEIGICSDPNQVLTGAELDELSEKEYLKVIENILVYARVSPENKVRIVKTLKSLDKVVAMTGDGVNDAPSLKMADIGVGMGITGTDVTKEVADLIVADDNFATIVSAVGEGRRIYSNIKKTVAFLFSANFAEILSIFIATLFFPELVFMVPVQILFVNLVTDSLPAIALGLEKAEKNIMQKHPRKSKETIFSNGTGAQIISMGVVQTLAIVFAFYIGFTLTGDNLIATSMAFYTLNLVQIMYLISVRVDTSIFKNNLFNNKWIWYSIGFAALVLGLVAFTPVGQFLSLTQINLMQWGICFGLSAIVLVLSELIKLVINKIKKEG